VNSGDPEGKAVPVPLVTPVVLLFSQTRRLTITDVTSGTGTAYPSGAS